jgi:hypothetical protein
MRQDAIFAELLETALLFYSSRTCETCNDRECAAYASDLKKYGVGMDCWRPREIVHIWDSERIR